MPGLLGAVLVTLPLVSRGNEVMVIVNDRSPDRHRVLLPGESILHGGLGPAILVRGRDNSVTGSNITIVSDSGAPNAPGAGRRPGGAATLRDSTVTVHDNDGLGLNANSSNGPARIDVTG